MRSRLPEVHLGPILAFHGRAEGLTLFNLLPTSIAKQGSRLMRLASVPLPLFRFFGTAIEGEGFTAPLDLCFLEDEGAFGSPPIFGGRPVIFWSTEETAPQWFCAILRARPIFALFLSEIPARVQAVAEAAQGNEVVWRALALDGPEGVAGLGGDATERIWLAVLDSLGECLGKAGAESFTLCYMPELKTPLPFSRWHAAAAYRSSSPWSEGLGALAVADDYVVGPNQVLLNHMRYKIPYWSGGPITTQSHQLAVELAWSIMGSRAISNMIRHFATVDSEDHPFIQLYKDHMPAPLLAMAQNLNKATDEQEKKDLIRQLYEGASASSAPESWIPLFTPPQLILICPSASLPLAEINSHVLNVGEDSISSLSEEDATYRDLVLSIASEGGRLAKFPQASNINQEKILDGLVRMIRLESLYLSAMGILYASRFGCPILKLDRAGRAAFEPFHAISSLLDSISALPHEEPDRRRRKTLALRDAVDRLAKETTALFSEPLQGLLSSLASPSHYGPIIHSLSDLPLEFMKSNGDYLGYVSEISRTPITPGTLLLKDYASTEPVDLLPTGSDNFLLVTPFEDDDPWLNAFLSASQNQSHMSKMKWRILGTKGSLVDELDDEQISFLVYFGHGIYDHERNSSALALRSGLFDGEMVKSLRRVPPVVALIGCDTAAASTVTSGLHQAFLQAGAHLVIGTSFPIPVYIGVQFLLLLTSNVISPGVLTGQGRGMHYRDLAHSLTVVRRRLRPTAELYSLLEQGIISLEKLEILQGAFLKRFAILTEEAQSNDWSQLKILTELLDEEGIVPPESQPNSWPTIPYPLFFTLSGFPWNFRSKEWL